MMLMQVGAPPEVVARLEEACASVATMGPAGTGCIGEDPALDQFMEAYCEMLTKYEQELSKPFKEAMVFLQRIESQFKALTISSSSASGDNISLSLYIYKYTHTHTSIYAHVISSGGDDLVDFFLFSLMKLGYVMHVCFILFTLRRACVWFSKDYICNCLVLAVASC